MYDHNQPQLNNRESGLDIIRVTAILFVIAGHFFFLHTNFMDTPITDINLFFQGALMSLFYVSVPLFVLLTGYLHRRKRYNEINLKTFNGIWKVTNPYLFYSVLFILFKIFYLNEDFSVFQYLKSLLNFTAIPYGWYIELYIGLFLLMPFLNILFEKLETKKNRLFLIGACVFNSSLPIFLNRGGIEILPNYFDIIGAITFYFVGMYIAEYKPKIKKTFLILGIVALCLSDAGVSLILNRAFAPIGGQVWSIYYLIIATALFLILYDLKCNSKLLSKLSIYTLDIYLCCGIFDKLYYPYFKNHFFESQQQFFVYILIIVPFVFFSSASVAFIKDFTFSSIKKLFGIKH